MSKQKPPPLRKQAIKELASQRTATARCDELCVFSNMPLVLSDDIADSRL